MQEQKPDFIDSQILIRFFKHSGDSYDIIGTILEGAYPHRTMRAAAGAALLEGRILKTLQEHITTNVLIA